MIPMARVETWFTQDLKQAVKVRYIEGNVFSQDNNGNVVGVEVFDNGAAATLAGTVSGSVIRADGATVALTGSLTSNKCSVVLPQAAYAVPGVISIVIKLTNGSDVTTLCAVVGNVYQSATDAAVDPGTIISDIASLIASIDEAVDSIPLDYSALSNGFRDSIETAFGLSDPGTWSSHTIKKSDGTTVSSSVYKITDFIPVVGSPVIYTTSPANNSSVLRERASIAFYSTNSASGYISSVDIQEGDDPQSIVWQSTKVPDGAKYMRIMIGNTLTDQFKCIQINPVALNADAILYRGGINSSSDVDDFLNPGIWYASSSSSLPVHWPVDAIVGSLIVFATKQSNGSGTMQMVVDYRNNAYIRYKRSGAWQEWNKLSYADAFDGVPTWNIMDAIYTIPSTVRGVTCQKTGSGTYHISGTKSSGADTPRFVLGGGYSTVPGKFEKGKTYDVYASGIDTYVWISAYFNNSSSDAQTLFKSNQPLNGDQNSHFTIPDDCTGISISIRFDDADTFDEDVNIYIIEKQPANKRKAVTDALVLDTSSISEISNIIASYPFTQQTVNGITGIKTGDNTFYISGTKGSATWTTLTIYRNKTTMPEGFEVGKTYSIYLNSYDVSFWVVAYSGSDDETGTPIYKSENNKHGDQFGTFTIPETDVQGLSLTLKCENAASFDETVTVVIAEVKTNAERSFITSVNSSANANNVRRLYSIGNSFLTGSVYQNYERLYECTYKDAIYGQIAMALNVTEENTVNIFHASTGFLSASQWFSPHLDVIEATDLSGYDYLLTHFNGADLYYKPLGTVNDSAGRTTLAAGVVELVEYVRNNYGLCKIILLGTPPYNSDVAGQNVFITPQGTQGNSINDMDNLMYKLALKYHFIYVSWQDLEISYHYMDYCDYHEGDTGAIHANSPDTYRALGEYAGTQIMAVNSPIAVGKLMSDL
jgi:hypothetical protein